VRITKSDNDLYFEPSGERNNVGFGFSNGFWSDFSNSARNSAGNKVEFRLR